MKNTPGSPVGSDVDGVVLRSLQAIAAANEQRYDEALELVTPLANEGNPQAQNMLGALYAQGWGVEQDFARAREWYEKAAAGGNPRAYFNLARMYALGSGVEKDCDKAVELWRTPAEQGDAVAQVNLASLYMDGFECLPQDSDEALRWYRMAAQAFSCGALSAAVPTSQYS